MNENLSYILAIELLSASQGIEFHKPLKTSSLLQRALAEVRTFSEPIEDDRSLANEIEALSGALIQGHVFGQSYKIFNVQ